MVNKTDIDDYENSKSCGIVEWMHENSLKSKLLNGYELIIVGEKATDITSIIIWVLVVHKIPFL